MYGDKPHVQYDYKRFADLNQRYRFLPPAVRRFLFNKSRWENWPVPVFLGGMFLIITAAPIRHIYRCCRLGIDEANRTKDDWFIKHRNKIK